VQHSSFPRTGRRGITVLALLLLIIALVILAFFLIRYLRQESGVGLESALGLSQECGVSFPSKSSAV
jgi:hypothetical protein